jgi:glutamate--cysteine ligase
VWTDTDNDRCGNIPFVFDEDFSFAKYVNWVLDVPMYFVYRDGVYLDATGHSFRDFIEGKLSFLPGEHPSSYCQFDTLHSAMASIWPALQ